jgi:hypothetical protein
MESHSGRLAMELPAMELAPALKLTTLQGRSF